MEDLYEFNSLEDFQVAFQQYSLDPNLDDVELTEQPKPNETVYVFGLRKGAFVLRSSVGYSSGYTNSEASIVLNEEFGERVTFIVSRPSKNEIANIKANLKLLFPGITDKQINTILLSVSLNPQALKLALSIGYIASPHWNGQFYQTTITNNQKNIINQVLTLLNNNTANWAKVAFAESIANGRIIVIN